MTDADTQIVQLLTEIRDAQREEIEYRRRATEESLALQRRAIATQRIVFKFLMVLLVIAGLLGALLVAAKLATMDNDAREKPNGPIVRLGG
jgi:hypothetical protein